MEQLVALGKPLLLDLFGSFFIQLRDAPLSLARTLNELNARGNLKVWIDGPGSQEKLKTHYERTLAKISAHNK